MNTSGDRLKHLLFECNLSPSDFAAHRNVTPQHINNWFNRGVPAALVDEVAILLSVRPYWLRTGRGAKYITTVKPCAPFEPAPLTLVRSRDTRQAGAMEKASSRSNDVLIAFHTLYEGTLTPTRSSNLRLPRAALESVGVTPDNAAALLMPGTSMLDRLQPGSPLAIDRSLTHIIDGQPYALIHEDALQVCYLYRQVNGALRMRHHNFIEHADKTLDARESGPGELCVLGWMFWHASLSVQRPTSDPDTSVRGGHSRRI